MALPQILRSRTQIALPLLRRSIRVQTQYMAFHPRCFTTALPRNGESEACAITPPPTSATTSPQTEESETSVITLPQNEEPETPSTTQPKGTSIGEGVHLAPRFSFVVRRVASKVPEIVLMESFTTPKLLQLTSLTASTDQGFRMLNIRKLMEACRSPYIVPGDAIMISKAYLDPENRLQKRSYIITHSALAEERKWVAFREDDEQISPIMKKLEIESIENDMGRYMVMNTNLRRLGIGIVEQSDDSEPSITAIERLFPRRISDNVDIINRGSNASHVVIEVKFGEFCALDKVEAIAHVLHQCAYLVGEYTRIFNSLWEKMFHKRPTVLSGRYYKRILYLFEKTGLYARGILDSPPGAELVRIPTAYGGEKRTMPLGDAMWNYERGSKEALDKLQSLVDHFLGKVPDAEMVIMQSNARLERRIGHNIRIVKESEGLGMIKIRSGDGKQVMKKIDALNVVMRQIDRTLRGFNEFLTSLGLHPRSEKFTDKSQKDVVKEVRFASDTLIIPTPPQLQAQTSPPSPSFTPGPTISDIPGNKRDYSTNSPTNHASKSWVPNEFDRPLPGGIVRRKFVQDIGKEPTKRNAFGRPIRDPIKYWNANPPLPGQSVKEKMLAKEEERLKVMQGLGYSLMASSHMEGGSVTVEDVVEKDTNGNVGIWEGGEEMGGLTDESGLTPLKKGDMCELRSGSSSTLAIYLRPSLHGQPTADFLTEKGEIVLLPPTRVNFFIPSFISEESTTAIINHYDQVYENSSLQPSNYSEIVLPRMEMLEILDKVRAFSKESHKSYAEAKSRFDKLYERVALEGDDTELTLFEATEEIFGPKHGDVELYTTHLALMEDGVRYMADKAVHRATNTFKVRSKNDVRMIEFVTEKVRTSTKHDDSVRRGGPQRFQIDIFQEFINKARYLIDLSRENEKEDLTATSRGVKRIEIKDVVWDDRDRLFINYIKASILQYGTQAVPMDGLVPVILRAVERYEGELSPIIAYQFCTEIGAWGRWENLALRQKNITFPGHGTSKVADEDHRYLSEIDSPQALDRMGIVDSMAHIRKDWGNMEVFCIDDASAHEIDDGISLERVNENVNWVHVHIANPTAWLPSNHWLSDLAFRRKQSLYLPEQVFPMLPPSLTERIGLRPNIGVMTMSAKIAMDGKVLDSNVQAGFVRNVKRFTYDDVSKALGRPKVDTLKIQVGNFPKSDYQPTLAKLGKKQIADLRTLADIAIGFRKARAKNNMIIVNSPGFDVDIYTGLKSYIHPTESYHPNLYRGYPSIRLTVDTRLSQDAAGSANFVVSELMQLANSVTAKFCGANNIAAPFRVMEYDYERKDCMTSFKNDILPSRDEFGTVPVERGLKYMMLVGQTRINASPKPHRLMGLDDGYVRATSPLRRYSDMITHYQIQSYLLGKEPRTHRQLKPFVSEMDRGERLCAFTMKESKRFWAAVGIRRILELGEQKLPKNMTFVLMDKPPYPTMATGLVLELGMAGKLRFANNKEESSVKVGDVVNVELFAAMPGEKFVWFDFKGIAKQSESDI